MSTKSKDPKKNAENLKILEGLLANPENRVCADCASRGPRWCSTTWGVFICIRCSGFHRSMGTHITRVKSVSQDFFTDDEVNTLRSNGNAIANDSLEARLRPSDKPRMDSTDDFVHTFLRAKYEHLRFAPAGWVPPHKRAEHFASHPPGRGPAEFGSPSASPPSGYGARQPTHAHAHAHRTPTVVPPPTSTATPTHHHHHQQQQQPQPTPVPSVPLVTPAPPTPQPQISFPEDPSIKAKHDIMSLFDSTPSVGFVQPGVGAAGMPGMMAPVHGMGFPGMMGAPMGQPMMMPGFAMPGQQPMMAPMMGQPGMMPGFGMPGAAPGGFGMPGTAPGGFGMPGAAPGGFGMPGAAPGGFGMPGAAPGGFGMPGAAHGGFGMPGAAPGGFGMTGPAAPGGFGMVAAAPGGFGMPAGYPGAGSVAPPLQTATPQPPKKQEPDPFASLVSFS